MEHLRGIVFHPTSSSYSISVALGSHWDPYPCLRHDQLRSTIATLPYFHTATLPHHYTATLLCGTSVLMVRYALDVDMWDIKSTGALRATLSSRTFSWFVRRCSILGRNSTVGV